VVIIFFSFLFSFVASSPQKSGSSPLKHCGTQKSGGAMALTYHKDINVGTWLNGVAEVIMAQEYPSDARYTIL
jgi:hypothetical protein